MTFLGEIGDVTETRKIVGVFSLEWRIPDLLSLASKEGDNYNSPNFLSCDGEWAFKIYPKKLANYSPTDSMTLVLFRMDAGPPKTFHVTLGIRGSEGVENQRERQQKFYLFDDRACFWSEFCPRSELEDNMSRLMPGKELIITCDMRCDVQSMPRGVSSNQDASIQTDGQSRELNTLTGSQLSDAQDASTQTEAEFKEARVPADDKQSSEKQGIEKVAEDMGNLLTSGNNSDITIQVKEAEFKVHRNILSARSPVLSAMLEHDTAERATNKICIDDCEPDVFEEYLRYIYTGSVRSLTQQSVFGVYRIADKYLAEDLKLLCLQHIRNTLCVQTFCDTVKLALTHGENDLLQLAIDFAIKNIRFIIISTEWQNFICEYPKEANEIFIKVLGPPS